MGVVFDKPESMTDVPHHYCPGCGHGIIHRLTAEAIDSLAIKHITVGVASVGCSVFAYNYFDCDMQQAAHGRAPAVATGIKRVNPDCIVFTYQGDGDLAAIGTAEIIHAAARRENITVIFVNNAIYGMTGGQMAPTTLLDQIATTAPYGRKAESQGYPIKVCEMLAALEGTAYVERVAIHDIKNIKNAKKAIQKAFSYQLQKIGFSLIEILSPCPTNWKMSPVQAFKWVEKMMSCYPLGVYKDIKKEMKL